MRTARENPFIEMASADNGTRGLKVSKPSLRPGEAGRISSTATNGTRNINSKTERTLRKQTLTALAKQTGIF